MGVSYGSSAGSPDAIVDFGSMLINGDGANLNASTYVKMMGHTIDVVTLIGNEFD